MKKLIILAVMTMGLVFVGAGQMAAQSSSVAGDWDAAMETPGGTRTFKIIFKVDGEKLTGTVKRTDGDHPLQGTVKGGALSFSYMIQYNGHDLQMDLGGKVTGDAISGTVSFGGQGDAEWTAKRTPAAKPKTD